MLFDKEPENLNVSKGFILTVNKVLAEESGCLKNIFH